MTILIDLDDVVWNLVDIWVFYLNKLYNLNVKTEDINEWDITKFFPTLTKEQILEPLKWESLWLNIRPFNDAIEYIDKLKDKNSIFFVTATDPRNVSFKYDLLSKYFPFVSFNNIIVAHDKSMVKGDILIDDKIENLKDRRIGILFDRPFNRNVDISIYPENIIRMSSWRDIYLFISSLNMIEV